MRASSAARRLLRTHFLRRFLDNDLISPHADRHEVLVLLAASLAVPGLVITVLFLGQKYVIGIPTPGLTSIAALDDKFFYICASMLIMALIAAVQWDALVLDDRDAAILGPLPVSARDIGRAKLAALVQFVGAFALILNVVPTILFPLLTVSHFHVSIIAIVWMIAVHGAVTVAAGGYAFLTVLLLRELLRWTLPEKWFRRVSAVVQAALVIVLGTAILLLPAIATNVPAKWLAGDDALRAVPPAWFLGLYESATEPITLALRDLGLRIPAGLIVAERDARILYDSLLPRFANLALASVVSFMATIAAALVLYVWNNRRLPLPRVSQQRARSALRRRAASIVSRLLVPSPVPRAGFFFTLNTLSRSAPHRMSIAGACAVATAAGILLTNGIKAISASAAAPARLLALQTVVLAIVLVGVRQALGIPAELRANWAFSMAWDGKIWPFMSGVKRAVIAAVVVPILAGLVPLHALHIGILAALAHAVVGFALSLVALELMLRPEKLPLTCSARPAGNLKALGPIYLMLLLVAAYNLARIERWALANGARFAGLVGCLVLIYAAARLRRMERPSLLARIELDDLPETSTQRLGLSEPV